MIRLTGKILTKLHAKWNFGLTNSTFHCYKKYFNSQQWLTLHTRQNTRDSKLYAYYSNVFPTRFGAVIWFLCFVPELCKITLYGINHVFNNHRFRLQNWNQLFLSAENLASYASAIHSKGAPLQTCFGFIHGTVQPSADPA